MANAIRRVFHSDLASLFVNDILYQRSNFYYFLGKTAPWNISDTVPETIQIDSQYENSLIRSNALFFKKIGPNDISLVIKRFDWEPNSVFSKWDHTQEMIDKKYYCVTDNNMVYKCLDNNGDSISTVKPSGTSFQVFNTSDGYLWKYMYTIPTFKQTRFTSLQYIPVQRALTDSFYNKGSVGEVVVDKQGIGYNNTQLTTINIAGMTTGSGASGRILTDISGKITSVVLTNGGFGYTSGVIINVKSDSGNNCLINAIIDSGVIIGTTIVSGGFGYISDDAISFQVGGAILIPAISNLTGSIESVKIINSGAGYNSTVVLQVFGENGIGKYNNSTALIEAVVYQGKIVNVTISDPGINYPSLNDTSIIVLGNGMNAAFSPVVYNGKVIDVIVENAGVGYSSMKLKVIGSGTGAIVKPVIAISDFLSDQSVVEQTVTLGAIYAINIDNPGSNYFMDSTSIAIDGDGAGCVATPVIDNGKIVKIIVKSYGKGYSYANVVITDASRNATNTSIDATAYAILPPIGGHGKDAVVELNASTVAINSSLQKEFFLGSINQDYRQFGIIKNPKNIVTGKYLDASSYLIIYSVVFDNIDGLEKNNILFFNGIKFRVVSINIGNIVIVQQLGSTTVNPIGTFVAELMIGDTPKKYQSSAVLSYPIANKYSGSLLYISNESAFSLTENQGINIKTFLTF